MNRISLILLFVLIFSRPLEATDNQPPPPRVLILLAERFNVQEYYGGWVPLAALGYEIDVAGIETGTVFANPDRPSERDTEANLTLEQVNPDKYIGLFIPGGYSPGSLENHARALEIVESFMKSGKPVAAVCHGPRLIMRTGQLKDRNFTSLFSLPNEIADLWASRPFGNYLDQAVVIDGNLVTSRYPNDMPPFSQAMAQLFERAGGIPLKLSDATVVIIEESTIPHRRWFYSQLRILGMTVNIFDLERDVPEPPEGAVVLVNLDTALLQPESDLMRVIEKSSLLISPGGWQPPEYAGSVFAESAMEDAANLAAIYRAALQNGTVSTLPPLDNTPAPPEINLVSNDFDPDMEYSAVLALREGFDEQAAQEWLNHFEKMEISATLIVGPQTGTTEGMNGGKATVHATYNDSIKLASAALIAAPGGLWPEDDERARQREDAEWLREQGQRDRIREEWLIEAHNNGAVLFLTGFDALRLGRRTEFAGMQFAAPEQTMWSFGRDGGRYYRDGSATHSGKRIYSSRNYAIDQALELRHQNKQTE